MSARAPRRRGEEEEEEERLGGAVPGFAHPVNVDMVYRYFLGHIETPKMIARARGEQPLDVEDLQMIEVLASSIKKAFVSRGSLVVSVATRSAFAIDLKRKITIVYSIAVEVSNALKAELEDAMDALAAAVRGGDERAAAEARRRAVEAFRKLLLQHLATLKVVDELLGVYQINLPLDIMPNLIKIHLGVATT